MYRTSRTYVVFGACETLHGVRRKSISEQKLSTRYRLNDFIKTKIS